jgi:hypothetical protein
MLRSGDVDDDADDVRIATDDSIDPHGIRHGRPSAVLRGDRESYGRGRTVKKLREDGLEVFDRLLGNSLI